MLTNEFIELLHKNISNKEIKLHKTETRIILDTVFGTIEDLILSNDKIAIQNFGTFKQITAKERNGFEPLARKQIRIKEMKRAKFIPAKKLKFKLNKNEIK